MSFLNPTKIIDEISVSKNMKIVDFGCGSGGWSIPLAERSEDGMVYAVDVMSEALSALKSKADTERVYNIRTLLADIEKGTNLVGDSFDLAIVSNILFQAEDKEAVIKEAYRVLRQSGKMLVVDWNNIENVSENEINEQIKESGFQVVKRIDAGVSHFGILYEKK
ncbi:MAG: class I SAM-dependent methyltransferase [Patescibacteria group bacterium]|nr:class I SAM-dependent methyltransferase [Patescibacteria group bacterium]